DPRKVPGARIIPELSFEELLEMAAAGAQVMHARAVEIAARYDVDLRLGSSFDEGDDTIGTFVTRKPKRMEDLVLAGIAATPGQAKLVLTGLRPGLQTVTSILVALAEGGVSVDMIWESDDREGRMQLQLTLAEAAVAEAKQIVQGL